MKPSLAFITLSTVVILSLVGCNNSSSNTPVTQESNSSVTATQLANPDTLPTETNTLNATESQGTAVLDIPEIGSLTLEY